MFVKLFYGGQEEIEQVIEDVDGNGSSDEYHYTGILHHKYSHLHKILYIMPSKGRCGLQNT